MIDDWLLFGVVNYVFPLIFYSFGNDYLLLRICISLLKWSIAKMVARLTRIRMYRVRILLEISCSKLKLYTLKRSVI